MSNREQRQRTRPALASSHQRSWLWGRHAVLETLAARQWPVVELLVAEDLSEPDQFELHQLLTNDIMRVQRVASRRLTELCRSEDHQGFLARMGEFPCGSFVELQADLRSHSTSKTTTGMASLPALYVLCDRIQDAHNFGAILRCCDAMNAAGVIIGEKSQVSVTPHVARASSGAVNHQAIYRVASLVEAVQELKRAQVTVVAASEKATGSLWHADLSRAVCIMIGSEGSGIAPELLDECDSLVSIPMFGGVTSLNAAVAAGIVLYECRRQHQVNCI